MLKIISSILVAALLVTSGCFSVATLQKEGEQIQAFLNTSLPPDFIGDVHVAHINPYFNIGFDAGNVHKNAAGLWTWDTFSYTRADMFHTTGTITLTPKKT